MKVIDVFQQYYAGSCEVNGRPRHGADVRLTATSDSGQIRYDVSVNFFPHDTPEDWSISYDGFYSVTVYDAPGRRARGRERSLLAKLMATVDRLAAEHGGKVDWEHPLREARIG